MVVNSDAQEGLRKLGFGEYEARAYTQLLKENPVTAYELAKASGIPSSKIYEVLGKLTGRGVAMAWEDEGKQRFVPLSPRELVARHRTEMEDELDVLEENLRRDARDSRYSMVWNMRSRQELRIQARRMVQDTRKELVASLWQEEAGELGDLLQDLHEAGVQIATVCFGSNFRLPGTTYAHPIGDTLYKERGGRGITLVSDGTRALMATIFPGDRVEGAWSMNQGFVTLAEDYLKHDIYVMKIVGRMDRELKEHFGPGYRHLRDIFHDREGNPALEEGEGT